MSGPFIFISHSHVKPGKWEEHSEHVREATEMVETEEPRVIAFNSYATEDRTEVATVQVHPDSDSMETHLKLFFERLAERAFGALDTYAIDIFGTPSEGVLEALGDVPDVQVRVLPVHQTGFLRPQPL